MTLRHAVAPALAATILVAAGCSSVSVRSDWDTTVDFSRYDSFAFHDRRDAGPGSPLVHQRIERALTAELTARGFDQVPPPRADLAVTYTTAVQREVRVVHGGYYRHGPHWRWGYWGPTRVHTYRSGTLVVDVLDRRDRQLVWRGVAEGAFTRPDPTDERIAQVVAKVLAAFPPPR